MITTLDRCLASHVTLTVPVLSQISSVECEFSGRIFGPIRSNLNKIDKRIIAIYAYISIPYLGYFLTYLTFILSFG